MQKLHLVGFTTDHEGLILSTRRGARSGSYRVVVDEVLATAVEEARARQLAEAEAEATVEEIVRPARVESQLSIKEIQTRLRQGRSVADVARTAGVEPAWVERFAPPIFAEQGQVIRTVLGARLHRPRLGPSALPIGDAVRTALADRGASLTPDEIRTAWSARQLADGRWVVRASFRVRNKDTKLRYDLDDATGEVHPHDRMSATLGYVAPPAKPPAPKPSRTAAVERPEVKRATVTSGFRPDRPQKATSPAAKERERAALAMRKAAARSAVDAEKAAVRRAREKARELARQEREQRAATARAEREAAAAARAKAAEEQATARAKAKAAAEKAKVAAAKARAREKAAADRARAKAAQQAEAQRKRAEAALAAAERARKQAAKRAATAPAKKPSAKPATTASAKPATKAPAKVATTAPAKAMAKATTKKAPAQPAPAAVAKKATPARHLARETEPSPARNQEPQGPLAGEADRSPRPTPTEVDVTPEASELEGQLELLPAAGPAADVYGERSSRAVFRAGLLEATTEPAPDPVGPNGVVPRPPNRPRRTEPLRAT